MNKHKNGRNGRTIVVAVTDDLLTDQRVLRTCDAMHSVGYDVRLVGRSWPDGRPLAKPYRSVKMRLLFRRSALFYAEYNVRLFLKLLLARADAFYANDTDTLLAVGLAARLRRKPFVFDGHELFPDVSELDGKRFIQGAWRAIERRFIPSAAARITVNQSLADEYRRRYGVEFAVVRNLSATAKQSAEQSFTKTFTQSNNQTITHSNILLYQGAVNKGRCIRQIIDAMEFLPGYRFVVAGGGDLLDEMRRYASSRSYSERIEFKGRLEPDELHRLTPQASLGFCLMENIGLNYYLSLPNRIADYAAAGVPVLANDFPEMKRAVEKHRIGALADEPTIHNPRRLAALIEATVKEWAAMPAEEKEHRFAGARNDMSWQNEQKTLIDSIDTIFVKNFS